MLKRIGLPLLVVAFLGCLATLYLFSSKTKAIEATEAEKTLPYNLSIAAIIKDEADYLKEWIEFHRLVGVNHFYLYDNESSDNFMEVLDPYIKEGIVTVIDWPDRKPGRKSDENKIYLWVMLTQVGAYEHACWVSAKDQTKWLAFIDVDEFLVPTHADTMTAVLDKYSEAPGVEIHQLMIGTCGVKEVPKGMLFIEAVQGMTHSPNNEFLQSGFKSIVKPDQYVKWAWPPHKCVFKNNQQAVVLGDNEARYNHYMNRTLDYFYNKKIVRKEHMDNCKFSEEAIAYMLSFGNEVEDHERSIQRFVPALRKRMHLDQ